jgi:hypothetical protein
MNLFDLELGARDYEGEAAESKQILAGLGVTDEHRMPQRAPAPEPAMVDPTAGLLIAQPVMPKTRGEQDYEDNPVAATLKKMLIPRPIYKQMYGANSEYTQDLAKYKVDMDLYKTQQEKQLELQMAAQSATSEREMMDGLGTGLRDAFATEGTDDDLEWVMKARARGMDLADIKHYQNMAGHSYQAPSWETKFDNGVLIRYDKNGNSPAQPVLSYDGSPVTEKMDADMRKTSGWFKRAVPALENMHKLEDRGVSIPRQALLLTQQSQDANGFFDMTIYNKLLNDLSLNQDQKQYLRNAQDLAMIQLRKESGAAIGVQEMFNELNQNVMLDDFSDEGYEYQRSSRANKYRQLSSGMPDYLLDEYAEEGYFERLNKIRSGSARVIQDRPPELLDRNTSGDLPAPSVGAEKDGYIFNGGDPADPANWSAK